jgi:hypothetical protein
MSEIRIRRIWGRERTIGVSYLFFSLNVIWVIIKLKKVMCMEYIIDMYGVRYVCKTVVNLKGRDHLENLGVSGRTVLTCSGQLPCSIYIS